MRYLSSRHAFVGIVSCPALIALLISACATGEDIEPGDNGGSTHSGLGGGSGKGSGGMSASGAPGSGGMHASSGGAFNRSGGTLNSAGGTLASSGGRTAKGAGGSLFGAGGKTAQGSGGKTASAGGTTSAGGKFGGQGGVVLGSGGKTVGQGGGITGDAGSGTGSGTCDWTSAACAAMTCEKGCPANTGGYCAMACNTLIACVKKSPPTCNSTTDPLCVERKNGVAQPCTADWESASGYTAGGPGAVAAAYYQCACGG